MAHARTLSPTPFAKRSVFLLVVPLLFCALSCGGGDSVTDPKPEPVSWELGEPMTHDVQEDAGGVVVDDLTGRTFHFPNGGSGVLSVAPILDGPAAPYAGDGFWVEWTGNEPVEVEIEDTESEFDMLLAWTIPSGSFSNAAEPASTGERWVALAPDPAGENAFRFELPLPRGSGSPGPGFAARPTVGVPTTQHFQSASVPVGTQQTGMFDRTARANEFVVTWLNTMPASIRGAAQTRVSSMVPTFYGDDNYYIGFSRHFWGNLVTPMLGLVPTADDGTVAHEVGHYMSHVLLGDDAYLLLEDAAPQDHGIGEIHPGRTNMTEEWAHFSDYFLTGSIGFADPEEPSQLLTNANPNNGDYASREGFACLFLARLHSTNAKIRDITEPSKQLDFPVVGASFTDLIGILAEAPITINQLRVLVDAYLDSKGKEDLLPVILERIGWRYMGTGRLVDPDGEPLQNVTVRKLAKAGGKEYYPTTASSLTDDKGKIGFTHFFPGSSYLRVYQDGDSVDVPIFVNPDLPTDGDVDLGDITVDFSNLLKQLQSTTGIVVNIKGAHQATFGAMSPDTQIFSPTMSGVTWNGTGFSGESSQSGMTYSVVRTLTGSVSTDGRRLVSLTYTYTFRSDTPDAPQGTLREETDTKVTITGVDFTDLYYGFLRFQILGPQVGAHVSLSYRRLVEWENEEFGTEIEEYEETDWNSTTPSASLAVYFDL